MLLLGSASLTAYAEPVRQALPEAHVPCFPVPRGILASVMQTASRWHVLPSGSEMRTWLSTQTQCAIPPRFTNDRCHPAFSCLRPCRVIELRTGELLIGEILSADSDRIELRRPPNVRVKLPRALVASISNPAGLVDVAEELAVPATAGTPSVLERPLANGLLQVWQRSSTKTEVKPGAPLRLRFASEVATPMDLIVRITSDGAWKVEVPAPWSQHFRQSLPVDSQPWRPLLVRWGDAAWSVQVGGALLAKGTKPEGALEEIVSAGETLTEDSPFRDLVLRRVSTVGTHPAPWDATQDAITLVDGTVLYGAFVAASRRELVLAQVAGNLRIPWSDFRQVAFASPENNVAAWSRPVTGLIAELRGPEMGGELALPAERLIGAVTDFDGSGARLTHPLFNASVSPGDNWRMRPLYFGTWQWLLPGMVRLGDEVRDDLQPAIPRGTSVAGEWWLPQAPLFTASISAEVVEMEPCGSATPPTQPFLSELRRGELVSELWVNGQRLGDWNSQLAWRPAPGVPTRIRIAVPPGVLHSGLNRWEIRQQPLRANGNYDDCLVGRMALETVNAR